ncbi:MAG: hypothetical protein A4E32_00640 [Methanomassiliicoccales archaeon PtaU1.Bin124]|nr:MAG: hypothetical protein A4E32_00640 [Methanomassiliicoccales archaeon PtaU1.Bin124]
MAKLKDSSVAEILGVSEDNPRTNGDIISLTLGIVRQNPDGVTAKMVADATGVTERRSRDILKELVMRREIYDREVPGIKSKLYYPNGKLVHKYLQTSKEFGHQTFRLSLHEGKRVPRLQIQERKFSLLNGETVEGAIFVDSDHAREMAEFIIETMNKFEIQDPGKGVFVR